MAVQKNSATRGWKLIKTREESITMRKRRKKGGGKMKKGTGEEGGKKLVPNFSLSVLGSSTGTDVVSFINRLDSTTDERKTCSYAICHGDGILLKLTKR